MGSRNRRINASFGRYPRTAQCPGVHAYSLDLRLDLSHIVKIERW